MPHPSNLAVFVVAATVLLLTPGPNVLYIVARSINQGRWAGVISALGVGTGNVVHVSAATLGLSALLLSSALAFGLVRYVGAAYLIYIGIRTMLARGALEGADAAEQRSLSRIYTQGLVVNVLNPKTALFFLAFLPQFVEPSQGRLAAQILMLGGIWIGIGICTDSLYGLLAGSLGGWLRGNLGFLRTQRYVSGSVFVGLGLTTALVSIERK